MGFFDFLSKKPSNNVGVHLKVKEIMTPNPIVVSGTSTIAQIEEIFNKNSIWSIYVGDPDNYIGIITRDDLKFRVKNKSKSSPAYSIMSKGVFSIDENADVEEAKTFLYKKKINGLAVTRDGRHCGIITRYDIKNKQSRSFDISQKETPRIVPQSPSPSQPRNDGQIWTNDDIQLLRQSWCEGKSIEIIAHLLERSPDAVVHKLIDTGLIGYNDDNCDPKPARFGLTWNDHERAQLISEFNAGKSIPEIAKIHQRNKNTILHNLVKLRIINYNDRSILEEYIENNIPQDTNQLIRTLISELENNSNSDFRNSAATQLGSFQEPSVVNALINCVKNDPKVRYRALAALRNIGDPLGIPVFIERLKDRSVRIRLVSVNALGELGDLNVVKHLESHIKSKDYQNALKNGGNPEIIQAARDAIQKIRSRQHVGEVQTDLPNDQSDTHVLSSIQEIDARIKKGSASEVVAKGELPFIINCARHSHKDIRKHANWVLGNLALNGEANQVVQAGAVPILIGALSDQYEWARSSSAWALSALAEKGQAQNLVKMGVIPPLISGLKDSDNLMRGCTARALNKIAYAGFANDLITCNAVPPLIQNLEDYFDNVRKKSIWALWSIAVKGKTDIFGQDRVLKPLIKYVLDKDVDVRSGSLHLLGVLGRKGLSERIIIAGVTSPLIKSLSSRSRRVRGAAAWALGEIDQGMNGDEFIQSGAITELKKISNNSDIILIFDETHSSWEEKSIHEIVEDTLRILTRKFPSNPSLGNAFPDLLSPQASLQVISSTTPASLSHPSAPDFVIERTIFDPVSGTFLISRTRPLVNVEDWIRKTDPNSYWFILCIHNNSNTLIDEWGIELDSSASLKILECHIEGVDHTPALNESHPVPWQSKWMVGVPHHFGITLPRKGSRRLYFKLSSSTCGVSHSITGNLIAPREIQIPIAEKSFDHSCDVATLSTAFFKNPSAAEQYTENLLKRSYSRETALKYIQTFKLVQEIDRSCTIGNHDATIDKLNQLIDALEGTQVSKSLIESVKSNLWAIQELGDTEDASTRGQHLCQNIVDDWLNEVIYKQKKLG